MRRRVGGFDSYEQPGSGDSASAVVSVAAVDQQARISQKLITSLLEFESVSGWPNPGSANGVTLIYIRIARFRGRSFGRIVTACGELTARMGVAAHTSAVPGCNGARLMTSSSTFAMPGSLSL